MGHLAKYCPQNKQRPQQPQQPPLPAPVQTQQFSGPSGYVPTGRGGAYHYLRIPISRVVMASTQEDTCGISRMAWVSIQPAGHSGSLEDSPNRLMLLPVVLDHRGNTVSQVREVMRRAEVFTLVEVKEDDSRPRGVSTTLLCRTPRTILT